ncbi:MAG: cytochrome b5-like heme/steroid binding domain-containing protein [Minisyncoccia bacterium]
MKKITLIALFAVITMIIIASTTNIFDSSSEKTVIYTTKPVTTERVVVTEKPIEQVVTESSKPVSEKKFTTTGVAKHSSENDCWVIINEKVYDLTAYIPMHPGGQSEIINRCGGDATIPFNRERKHSNAGVQAELAYYMLGSL